MPCFNSSTYFAKQLVGVLPATLASQQTCSMTPTMELRGDFFRPPRIVSCMSFLLTMIEISQPLARTVEIQLSI